MFASRVNSQQFDEMKQETGLKCSFSDFPTMLIKLLNNSITEVGKEPSQYFCQLFMSSDSSATFRIEQKLEFRQVMMLQIQMKLGDEDEINNHVIYKYQIVNHQLLESQKKLDQICDILKLKNPSLIYQINKAARIDEPYQAKYY